MTIGVFKWINKYHKVDECPNEFIESSMKRIRQLYTYYTKLLVSLTLRTLQDWIFKKECGIYWRRHIREMIVWKRFDFKHLGMSWKAWRWKDIAC